MTPRDTLALDVDEPIVLITITEDDGRVFPVSGPIPQSTAALRCSRLRDRHPGGKYDIVPTTRRPL